jgi:citrate synthase
MTNEHLGDQEFAEVRLSDGQTVRLPIIKGTAGNERAIDISNLRAETGYITLDVGYMNTGSCISDITFIDGEQGILRYRGIPIEELAERSSFIETSYLLLYGNLPSQSELSKFESRVKNHTLLHEDIKRFYDGFPRSAHPMTILAAVVSSLAAFYQHESSDEEETFDLNCIRLLAKLPTIAAFSYKKSVGQPFIYPDNRKSYCENFLYMMFAYPTTEYQVDEDFVAALNLLLVLHADHEQNCSTSTVRLVRSSLANIFACISAGICALWGKRHGGANEEVIKMLEEIRDSGGNVQKFVDQAKVKNSKNKLMGFGHRVYKNFDPRAKVIKNACDKLVNKSHKKDELLDIAKELEEVALNDPYFIERKLYPNVDFYSGIIYRAMGIPVDAFTVMFALGRLPGWLAHAKEYNREPARRIGRPRQIYVGKDYERYKPISSR